LLFTDQLNRTISIEDYPQRIVSLVPSQTEFLSDAGLDDRIAGITKFCIHPEKIFRSKPRVGGTKKLDFEKIRQISPDLIIGNKEENDQHQIRQLMERYPVWMSDVRTLDHAFDMMERIGTICGVAVEAEKITDGIKKEFKRLPDPAAKIKACYLIWNDPYMTINSDTFIHAMMEKAGLENVFAHMPGRYPEISMSDLQQKNPSVILLSSEPFPFNERHRELLSGLLPLSKVILCDGELFSWYGSRLKLAPAYLMELISSI
jgi:ABC-type Fe3+-hydroxamate transport system substrate-binding protein